jgi:uncharacterized protein YkwD/uncharacterized protein YgiM (DUF1202 family)
MKKLFFSLLLLIILAPAAFAADCFQDPIYDRDWNGEVTTGMFVRDVACMEGSKVLTTVPVGQVVKVIAETDGWYKVQTKDGIVGWAGQWLLTQTSKPFSGTVAEAPKEPLYDMVGNVYEDAVRYLAGKKIVQGYADGSYQPNKSVNRAEFTKIIVGAKLGSEPAKPTSNCFSDVNKSEWYASWVCYAKDQGIIGGYSDGTFKPSANINLAEAAKILVNTLGVSKSTDTGGEWYEVYIKSLQNSSYIPSSFSSISQMVNRGQMAEMIYRIMEEIKNKPAKTFTFAVPKTSQTDSANLTCLDDQMPANVDMDEVRSEWLKWHNAARASRGVAPLALNTGLNYSSSLWAKSNNEGGELTHNRPGGQSLTDWFADVGIVFKKLSGMMYGENLGLRTYRCSSADCTDEAVAAARTIFDAFMAEEGTNNTGHYDNIVEPDFVELGLGMAVDSSQEIVYLTTQYSFGVQSYPSDICK